MASISLSASILVDEKILVEHLLPSNTYEGLFVVGGLVGDLEMVGVAVAGEAVGLEVVGARTIHTPLQLPSHWDCIAWHQSLVGCSQVPEPQEQHPSPKLTDGFGAGVLEEMGFVGPLEESSSRPHEPSIQSPGLQQS